MMRNSDVFDEVLNDTRELVQRAAQGTGSTITVSPEVAEMLEQIDAPSPVPDTPATQAKPAAARPRPAVPPPESPDPDVVAELAALEKTVSECIQCRLSETRNKTVFGDGHPNADLVFVGEAPGADEDRQGEPFVGRAGQLLTDIIEKGMKMKRSDVYICNVIKCRPPGNRDPRADEKVACEPYLVRQLELIKPKTICALGTYAAQTLLQTDTSIGRLRGKWHFYHGIPLRATYHPAYLLRSPAEKRKTWEDIQAVLRLLTGDETPEPPEPAPAPAQTPDLFS